jgi:hypothetical protein
MIYIHRQKFLSIIVFSGQQPCQYGINLKMYECYKSCIKLQYMGMSLNLFCGQNKLLKSTDLVYST